MSAVEYVEYVEYVENARPLVTCDRFEEPHPMNTGCHNPRPWGDPMHTPYFREVEHTDPPNIIRGEN